MTKNLSALLDRAADIQNRLDSLTKQHQQIRDEKEATINAAKVDDPKAFEKVDDLGSRERMIGIALDKGKRELAGMGAALLNESAHVIKAVSARLIAMREGESTRLQAALAKFYTGGERQVLQAYRELHPTPLNLQLSKLISGLSSYNFHPSTTTELAFAEQVLGTANRATETFQLA